MMEAKKILTYCENFYDIINFEPMEGDNVTPKMINIYHDYVFKEEELNEERIESIKNLDKAMKKYIDDYLFRKDMQSCVLSMKVQKDAGDILKILIDKIIDFFLNYSHYTTRIIYISKWI